MVGTLTLESKKTSIGLINLQGNDQIIQSLLINCTAVILMFVPLMVRLLEIEKQLPLMLIFVNEKGYSITKFELLDF